jgi:hypothetical protein
VNGKYSFDELREQLKLISAAEVMQMLKDYKVSLVSNTELTTFIKLINYKLGQRYNLNTLSFKGFIELFIQIAIYTFSKDERYRGVYMPPLDCVKLLLNNFKQNTNTDITTESTIQELNRLIVANPYYPLPEGYKKTEEKVIIENYTIPYGVKISEGIRIGVEILDTILVQALGIHIIEPITTYKYINKVVAIPKVINDSSFISPRRNPRIMQTKHTESLKVMSKTEIRVQEADAIKDGSTSLLNKAMKNKIERKREEELGRERKEQRRKERAALLKEALEQLKHEKEKKDKEVAEQL